MRRLPTARASVGIRHDSYVLLTSISTTAHGVKTMEDETILGIEVCWVSHNLELTLKCLINFSMYSCFGSRTFIFLLSVDYIFIFYSTTLLLSFSLYFLNVFSFIWYGIYYITTWFCGKDPVIVKLMFWLSLMPCLLSLWSCWVFRFDLVSLRSFLYLDRIMESFNTV